MRQHNLTPLDLIVAETSSDLAMWTNDGRLAGDRNPQVRIVTLMDGFLKCNEPCAHQIGAPNGEVPLCRCTKIIVGARQSGASPFRCGRYPAQDHLTLRFSADDFPRLLTISNSTCWPSLSVDRPALSTAEMCTNTSCPPPCGWMNP